MSLLGLARHLAEIERATFRALMAGLDAPRLFCSETDRDGDFDGALPDPRVVAEAWDAWRAEADFATRFVAEALVGMTEEYARHMGHADLLRERIDGRIGQ